MFPAMMTMAVTINPAVPPMPAPIKVARLYVTRRSAQCAVSKARIREYETELLSKRITKSPPSKMLCANAPSCASFPFLLALSFN